MGQTIEAHVPLTREEIDVLSRVLSALEVTGTKLDRLAVLHGSDLSLTKDEDKAFVSARTKIVQLRRAV